MAKLVYNVAVIEEVVAGLTQVIGATRNKPVVTIALGIAKQKGHMLNEVSVVAEGKKFVKKFFNAEGVLDMDPATIKVDSEKLLKTLKAMTLFKADIAMEVKDGGLELVSGSARQVVSAIERDVVQFTASNELQMQLRAEATGFNTALRKVLALSKEGDILSLNIDNAGKTYLTSAYGRGSMLCLQEVQAQINQNCLMLNAIKQFMTENGEALSNAIKNQSVEGLASLKEAGIAVEEKDSFKAIYFTVGGKPAVVMAEIQGAIRTDAETFLGNDAEKQKALVQAYPGIRVEVGTVVQSYFKNYSMTENITMGDAKLIAGIFGNVTSVTINVTDKTVTVFGGGMELTVAKSAAKTLTLEMMEGVISRKAGPYKNGETDTVVTDVLVDRDEVLTALNFLQETSSRKAGEIIPVMIGVSGNKVTLAAYNEPNGIVTIGALNEVPEAEFCGVLSQLKSILNACAKGTVKLSMDNVIALQVTPATEEETLRDVTMVTKVDAEKATAVAQDEK